MTLLTNNIEIVEYPLRKAQELVDKFHKHNIKPQGHKFTLAVFRNESLDHWDFDNEDEIRGRFAIKGDYEGDWDEDEFYEDWESGIHNLFYSAKLDQRVLDVHINGDLRQLIVEVKPDRVLNGIAVCGRPINRHLDDGKTLEITRICFVGEEDFDEFDYELATKNPIHASPIPSMLVGAVCKKAREMGYKRIITYTRADESGIYYKAANFKITLRQKRARVWKSKNQAAINAKSKPSPKIRWERWL